MDDEIRESLVCPILTSHVSDFVTSRGLVGAGPSEWDFFEMCKHVVMLEFPESTPCTVDVLINNAE